MQDETLSELAPVLAPLFIGILLVAPFTIRRALRPLGRLSAEAALIEPSRTDVRLQETGVPSEILPLVRAINTALQRIDEGFELQRRFTTNAAHELRTPLAILRARIDGLEDGEAKSGLSKDVERMTRLVSQLLTAGRLEMQPPSLDGSVDLAAIARETVERLAILPAAREHELRLHLPERPVIIRGEEEALGDALRNLIDNALAHSPAGKPVEIMVGGGWQRRGPRPRAWRPARASRADLRALLAGEQIGRRGRRPRAFHRARHRQGPSRQHQRRRQSGRRHHLSARFPAPPSRLEPGERGIFRGT